MVSAANGLEKPVCGRPVWRCNQCGRSIAGNGTPDRCLHPACMSTDIERSTCRMPPGYGTEHNGLGPCKHHGGNTQLALSAVERHNELQRYEKEKQRLAREAQRELAREGRKLGFSVETTPVEALEAMLCESMGNVEVLRMLVGDLDVPLTEERTARQSLRLIAHPLVELYGQERDRLAQLAAVCAKLGLDERKVQLAEGQIRRLLDATVRAMKRAGFDEDDQERFKDALAQELRGG